MSTNESKSNTVSGGSALKDSYIVAPVPDGDIEAVRSAMSRRRPVQDSVPGFDLVTGYLFGWDLLDKFDQQDLVGTVSAEVEERPMPWVFPGKEVADLTSLVESYLPTLYEIIWPQVRRFMQTFNKNSRSGYPLWRVTPKEADVDSMMKFTLERGSTWAQRSATLINVRISPESRTKERENIYLRDGVPEKVLVDEAFRTMHVRGLGEVVAARTRIIFNPCMLNLPKQVVDSAIHSVLLSYPAMKHDMTGGRHLPVDPQYQLAFDIKSFERHTAGATHSRAQVVGGLYQEYNQIIEDSPYIVTDGPCSKGGKFEKLAYCWPNREAGFMTQFASGDSAVAPAQKEVLMSLYAEFFVRQRGMDKRNALLTAMNGGLGGWLTIMNYGDDNFVSGKKEVCDDLLAFMGQYLDVEPEPSPKFLGFEYMGPRLGFRLPISSYVTKVALNERGASTRFRSYPFLGWMKKREIYRKIGDPRCVTEVFPYEDNLLRKFGSSWANVLEKGRNEERLAARGLSPWLSDLWLLNKDYMMTPEEQLATGTYAGWSQETTTRILHKMLGSYWNKRLKI